MKSHEKHCTANPERICRMHVNFDEPQRSMAELRGALNTTLPDCGMAELRRLSGNCPMCILATIRQSGICKFEGPENPPPDLSFDFKAELASAWAIINDAKAVEEPRYETAYFG